MLNPKYFGYYLVFLANIISLMLGLWDFDFGDYTSQIQNLLSGQWLLENGNVIHRYPPLTAILYATFIKICFSKQIGVFLLHNIFCFFILFFSDKIIHRFVPNLNNKAHFFKALIILNPFMYSFVIRGVNSELLFIFMNLAVLSILIKDQFDFKFNNKKSLFYLFLLIGLSMLTRTQGLALLLTVILALFIKKSFKNIAIVILGTFITILPWQTYIHFNNNQSKNPFISSGGLNSFRDGLTLNNKSFRKKITMPNSVKEFSDAFYHKYYVEKNYDVTEKEYVVKNLMDNPKLFFDLFFFKLKRCFYGTDSQNPKVELFNLILVSIFSIFNVFVLFNLKKSGAEFKFIYLLSLFYLMLTIGMSMVVLSILRYQIPVFILILILNLIFIFNHKKRYFQPIELPS